MLRKPVTIALASWLVVFSSVASADAPARDLAHAHVIVSADRVMPLVTYESVTTTNPNDNNQSVTVSGVSVAFVTHGSRNTILTIPRFGLDFVVSPGVTLGLSAWVSTTLSESAQIKGQTLLPTARQRSSSVAQDLPMWSPGASG